MENNESNAEPEKDVKLNRKLYCFLWKLLTIVNESIASQFQKVIMQKERREKGNVPFVENGTVRYEQY